MNLWKSIDNSFFHVLISHSNIIIKFLWLDKVRTLSFSFHTTGTTNSCPLLDQMKDKENLTEENLSAKQAELDLMWSKIQELKETDEFAAQIMYEKYRAMSGEIPPAIPSHIIADQAVS